MNKAIYTAIEQQFKSRVEAFRQQGDKLKPGSVTYQRKQAEFFSGAMAALVAVTGQPLADIEAVFNEAAGSNVEVNKDYQKIMHGKSMPPHWVIAIMSGRDILSETNSLTKQS